MAEETKPGSESGFLLLFFGGIFVFWLLSGAGEGPGLFGDTASSTEDATSTIDLYFSNATATPDR